MPKFTTQAIDKILLPIVPKSTIKYGYQNAYMKKVATYRKRYTYGYIIHRPTKYEKAIKIWCGECTQKMREMKEALINNGYKVEEHGFYLCVIE